MKRAMENFNTKFNLEHPVYEEHLLQVVKNVCVFAFLPRNRMEKIECIVDTKCLISAMCNFNKRDYRDRILNARKSYYDQVNELGDKGKNLVKLACALDTCIMILDSDSLEWKAALTKKLLDTKTTLKKMLARLKAKESTKHHHATSAAVEVMSRSHRQRRERESDSRSNAVIENTHQSSTNNGF